MKPFLTLIVIVMAGGAIRALADELPQTMVNSQGLKMLLVMPGTFAMGSTDGEFDERPVHRVTITHAFYMAEVEITNAQYERFDPAHKVLRGKRGISKADDEPVVFVSWNEAVRFCDWLSEKEGKPYRLPTEAEWEYACRAGTTTAYSTGKELPVKFYKSQKFSWDPVPVSLRVGQTPANPWKLYDMHGNVEEWCLDTYGPYPEGLQTDPVGREQGEMKVTRGGSHNTLPTFLRSANRSGTLPEDKHWLIGFRVVCARAPTTKPLPPVPAPLWACKVGEARNLPENHSQREGQAPVASEARQNEPVPGGTRKGTRSAWKPVVDMAQPYFAPPRRFVDIPAGSNGPLYSKHNHCPSITWCDNGDLLAVWFSTNDEDGREMTILASRLRDGARQWDAATEFFKAPDRNMTGSSLWNNGRGTLYHFNGLEAGGGWGNLALAMRTSHDHGFTWSQTRLIQPEHQRRNQVISGTICTRAGTIIQACDADWSARGGTAVHLSSDGGRTWVDPGAGTPSPRFAAGLSGGTIAGIHAGVVELRDGRLMALARNDNIGGHMPKSLSSDGGKTWTYSASEFIPISGGQRLVLARLREGPLLLCSYTDPSDAELKTGMTITDTSGTQRTVFGLFAAISEDEGQTWPVRRLISDDGRGTELDGGAWTGTFKMDAVHGEPRGYLCFTQSPDGMIHLLSSALHYQFNLAWLKSRPPAVP